MTRTLILILLLCLGTVELRAQEGSVSGADTLLIENGPREHSVRKATLYSTALPGLGQAYNRKYWKIPIVYAGLATCVYFINDNTKNYRYYRDALIAEQDGDPTTINPTGATASQIRDVMEQYRQWLDLSVIATALVYGLNIIDAHVDAHLFQFDVSDDLTMRLHPTAVATTRVNFGLGLTINF